MPVLLFPPSLLPTPQEVVPTGEEDKEEAEDEVEAALLLLLVLLRLKLFAII